jgi:predicted helicase
MNERSVRIIKESVVGKTFGVLKVSEDVWVNYILFLSVLLIKPSICSQPTSG